MAGQCYLKYRQTELRLDSSRLTRRKKFLEKRGKVRWANKKKPRNIQKNIEEREERRENEERREQEEKKRRKEKRRKKR